MTDGPIGYYVHHHGGGHAAKATAVARAVDHPVVGLGSGPPPSGWRGDWIALPHDADPPPAGDPTRNGAWHWAPDRHPGYTERMRRIAGWIADARPRAVVVDVSCEVLVLASLLGVPTIGVVLHGERTDRPHRTAFDSADALVGVWPASHLEPWSEPWRGKLHPLGLLSRFDGRTPGRDRTLGTVVLLPRGDHRFGRGDIEAAAAVSGGPWHVIGDVSGGLPGDAPGSAGSASSAGPSTSTATDVVWHGPVDDPWPLLSRAEVVVSAAGAATVADIAAARRPAVLLPQSRPFDEQHRLVDRLQHTGAPILAEASWPDARRWPDLLATARRLDVDRWSALHDGRAGARFAATIDLVAQRGRTGPGAGSA